MSQLSPRRSPRTRTPISSPFRALTRSQTPGTPCPSQTQLRSINDVIRSPIRPPPALILPYKAPLKRPIKVILHFWSLDVVRHNAAVSAKAVPGGKKEDPLVVEIVHAVGGLVGFKSQVWRAVNGVARVVDENFLAKDAVMRYRPGAPINTPRASSFITLDLRTHESFGNFRERVWEKSKTKTDVWVDIAERDKDPVNHQYMTAAQRAAQEKAALSKRLPALLNKESDMQTELNEYVEKVSAYALCSVRSHKWCLVEGSVHVPLFHNTLKIWAEAAQLDSKKDEKDRQTFVNRYPSRSIFGTLLGGTVLPSTPAPALQPTPNSSQTSQLFPPMTPHPMQSYDPTYRASVAPSSQGETLVMSSARPTLRPGKRMSLDTFADRYQLPIKVVDILRAEGFSEPQYLLEYSTDDFAGSKRDIRGFGMLKGHAAELYAKLRMWSQGEEWGGFPDQIDDAEEGGEGGEGSPEGSEVL